MADVAVEEPAAAAPDAELPDAPARLPRRLRAPRLTPAQAAAEACEAEAEPKAAVEEPPPPPNRVLAEPLVLGPKTFTTSDACFRYFSTVLSQMTLYQNCNEACPQPPP